MSELFGKMHLAKDAGYVRFPVSTATKDNALEAIANVICRTCHEIIAANNIDIENGRGTEYVVMIDRLTLTKERIDGIAEGVRQVKALADPIGEVIKMWKRPNGFDYRSKTCALWALLQ